MDFITFSLIWDPLTQSLERTSLTQAYQVFRIVMPTAFQELFREINVRMRKGLKKLKEHDMIVCEEAGIILDDINEDETFFLNSQLNRKRKIGNTYM